jgi:hypothetical protein
MATRLSKELPEYHPDEWQVISALPNFSLDKPVHHDRPVPAARIAAQFVLNNRFVEA